MDGTPTQPQNEDQLEGSRLRTTAGSEPGQADGNEQWGTILGEATSSRPGGFFLLETSNRYQDLDESRKAEEI
eukprot:14419945-Heterocapsa_arctica.AAC.1